VHVPLRGRAGDAAQPSGTVQPQLPPSAVTLRRKGMRDTRQVADDVQRVPGILGQEPPQLLQAGRGVTQRVDPPADVRAPSAGPIEVSRRRARLSVAALLVGGLGYLVGSLASPESGWVSPVARLVCAASVLVLIASGGFGRTGQLRRPRALAQAAGLPAPVVVTVVSFVPVALVVGIIVTVVRMFTY